MYPLWPGPVSRMGSADQPGNTFSRRDCQYLRCPFFFCRNCLPRTPRFFSFAVGCGPIARVLSMDGYLSLSPCWFGNILFGARFAKRGPCQKLSAGSAARFLHLYSRLVLPQSFPGGSPPVSRQTKPFPPSPSIPGCPVQSPGVACSSLLLFSVSKPRPATASSAVAKRFRSSALARSLCFSCSHSMAGP